MIQPRAARAHLRVAVEPVDNLGCPRLDCTGSQVAAGVEVDVAQAELGIAETGAKNRTDSTLASTAQKNLSALLGLLSRAPCGRVICPTWLTRLRIVGFLFGLPLRSSSRQVTQRGSEASKSSDRYSGLSSIAVSRDVLASRQVRPVSSEKRTLRVAYERAKG